NRHEVPVTELLVNYADHFVPQALAFAPHDTVSFDRRLGVAIYKLKTPLAPGASMPFDFDIDYAPKGFTNDSGETFLVHNGTFFNSGKLPQLGYQPDNQLTDRNDRRKYGLKLDVPRMPPTGSASTPPSPPPPTRSRWRQARCRRNGPRVAAAISTTRCSSRC